MMVRCGSDVSDGTLSEDISTFIEAMAPLLASSVFVKFERSAEGSNVRLPASWGGITEWGSGGTTDDQQAPLFYSFTGKDGAGVRFRLEIFGRNTGPNVNWRLAAVDDDSVAAAITAMQTTDDLFNTVGGGQPIYNSYANESVSQHWVGQARK